MAEPDRLTRTADAIKQMADEAEGKLIRDVGEFPDRPADKDWRCGYIRGLRDTEKVLRE